VDALLAHGVPVRALVRDTTNRRFLDPARVSFAVGDVTDTSPRGDAALAAAARGCAVVYHVAGLVQAVSPAAFMEANAAGAERMALVAAVARVPRFVLVSSQAAGGPTAGDAPRDETAPDRPHSAYGTSKLEGERRALAVAAGLPGEGRRLDVVIVRPPGVYGPRDTAFLRLFRLIQAGFAPLPGGPGQRVSLVHARDLAQGLLLAAERGRPGERYYLTSGPPVTAGALVDEMARALAKKPLRVSVPLGMLQGVAGLAEAWARARGQVPSVTRERVRDWAASRWTVDDAKARAELGYAPSVALAQGIEETTAWYRTAGWI